MMPLKFAGLEHQNLPRVQRRRHAGWPARGRMAIRAAGSGLEDRVWVPVSLAHRELRRVIDDVPMNALFDQKTKSLSMHFASIGGPYWLYLINCSLCHRLRLYAIRVGCLWEFKISEVDEWGGPVGLTNAINKTGGGVMNNKKIAVPDCA